MAEEPQQAVSEQTTDEKKELLQDLADNIESLDEDELKTIPIQKISVQGKDQYLWEDKDLASLDEDALQDLINKTNDLINRRLQEEEENRRNVNQALEASRNAHR